MEGLRIGQQPPNYFDYNSSIPDFPIDHFDLFEFCNEETRPTSINLLNFDGNPFFDNCRSQFVYGGKPEMVFHHCPLMVEHGVKPTPQPPRSGGGMTNNLAPPSYSMGFGETVNCQCQLMHSHQPNYFPIYPIYPKHTPSENIGGTSGFYRHSVYDDLHVGGSHHHGNNVYNSREPSFLDSPMDLDTTNVVMPISPSIDIMPVSPPLKGVDVKKEHNHEKHQHNSEVKHHGRGEIEVVKHKQTRASDKKKKVKVTATRRSMRNKSRQMRRVREESDDDGDCVNRSANIKKSIKKRMKRCWTKMTKEIFHQMVEYEKKNENIKQCELERIFNVNRSTYWRWKKQYRI